MTMARYLCKGQVSRLSIFSSTVRNLYSAHFGGGVATDEIPTTANTVLSQVLVLSPDKSQILLANHKHGDYKDRWTGLIGEVQSIETPASAAQRFVSNLPQLDISGGFEKRAILYFIEANGLTTEEHQFLASASSTLPVNETDNISPKWFAVSDIPYKDMPADDEVWYPPVLRGCFLRGTFMFNGLKLLKYSVSEVKSL